MGWEWRGRKRYYYGLLKVGPGGKKFYIGRGAEAEKTAQEVDLIHAKRQDHRRRQKEKQRRYIEVASQLTDYCRETEALAQMALAAAGFHKHHRGEWRQRRGHNTKN